MTAPDQEFALAVDGMHCGGCVKRVEAALAKLHGVTIDEVVIGKVRGSFDADELTADGVAAAVTSAGYAARVVPNDGPARG